MGSLMAGWDNNPWNEEKVLTRSRTSLTKEEIEEYWRKRQQAMEEHLREASAQKSANESESTSGKPNIDISQTVVEEVELPMAMSPDWWMRSNWAFLNCPPEKVVVSKYSTYTAQYEVANKHKQAV
jgi:hypothetical protein